MCATGKYTLIGQCDRSVTEPGGFSFFSLFKRPERRRRCRRAVWSPWWLGGSSTYAREATHGSRGGNARKPTTSHFETPDALLPTPSALRSTDQNTIIKQFLTAEKAARAFTPFCIIIQDYSTIFFHNCCRTTTVFIANQKM